MKLDCRASSRLLSDARDAPLAARERQALEAHLATCPACTLCRAQFAALGQVRLLAEPER